MEKIYKNRLKEILDEIGFTETAFADEYNLDPSNISKIVTGDKQLPLELAMKICEKYEFSLDWMYCKESLNSKNFLIDIRELFYCEQDKIYIKIPKKQLYYIFELNEIKNSDKHKINKKVNLSDLNEDFLNDDDQNEIIAIFEIPKDDFFEIFSNEYNEKINNQIIHINNENDKKRKSEIITDILEKDISTEELSSERKRILSKISSDKLSDEQVKKIEEFINKITKK